ncbi:MAG: hypothetical protein WBA51_08590 [Erythrobacter sp.]
MDSVLARIRGWLADRLDIKAQDARDGRWWEIDFILVLLLGVIVLGFLAWADL